MKKIIIVLMFIGMMVFPLKVKANNLTMENKVNIYLFWGSYCPHCHDFIKYMTDNKEKYEDYAEIVAFQIDADNQNGDLLDEVGKNYQDWNGGIPLIIIGDFHQVGFGKDGSNLITEAINYSKKIHVTDVVEEAINKLEIKVDGTSLEEAASIIGYKVKKDEEVVDNSKDKEVISSNKANDENKNYKSFRLTTKNIVYIVLGAVVGAIGLAIVILVIIKSTRKGMNK